MKYYVVIDNTNYTKTIVFKTGSEAAALEAKNEWDDYYMGRGQVPSIQIKVYELPD